MLERFFDESGGMQLVDSLAVRQPHQPRVGPRAAQALLPQVRFRAAGGRDRGRDRPVAVHEPQLSARRMSRAICIPTSVRPRAGAGDARGADVHGALALDRLDVARVAALPRRQEGAGAAAAHARRRSRWRRSFPTRSRAPRTSSASARSPTIRSCSRRSTIACTRRWTSRASSALLRRIESGAIEVVARDLTQPSPLALEILTARPYAYLDDAPLEERRTQAVMSRRWLDDATAADLGRLDVAAIERVRARSVAGGRQRRRAARRAARARMPHRCGSAARRRLGRLDAGARARRPRHADRGSCGRDDARAPLSLWVAAERLPQLQASIPR